MIQMGICKGTCGKTRSVPIVNKKYYLCNDCNHIRLGRGGDRRAVILQRYKPIKATGFSRKLSAKAKEEIRLDEEFYKEVWNARHHVCEECEVFLGDALFNDDGKMIGKFRFSHVIPKGRDSRFRRLAININLLCLTHHTMWEDGDQESMKIYPENMKKIDIMYGQVNEAK